MILLTFVFYFTSAEEILLVVEVARHGAREPLHEHDWYKPEKPHALTPSGMRQHCALGREFALRYSKILPKQYDPSVVYTRSTDTDRTIKSALA